MFVTSITGLPLPGLLGTHIYVLYVGRTIAISIRLGWIGIQCCPFVSQLFTVGIDRLVE